MESLQAPTPRRRLRWRARALGRAVMQMQMVPMFVWSGINASGELGLLPPPLAGEGWGGGERAHMNFFACPLDLVACPLPIPPPHAGEGMHRACDNAPSL